MSRALLLSFPMALGLAVVACSSAPGTQIKAEMQTLREEQSPDKLVARGRAFMVVGDFVRAEQYLAAALDSGVDHKIVMPLLLRACTAERRYRVALDYAEPLLRAHPEDAQLRFVVASLHASIGNMDEARDHLEIVAEQRPENAEAHFALATLLLDGGDPVGADSHFRQYLRLRPDGPHASEARGSLLRTVP